MTAASSPSDNLRQAKCIQLARAFDALPRRGDGMPANLQWAIKALADMDTDGPGDPKGRALEMYRGRSEMVRYGRLPDLRAHAVTTIVTSAYRLTTGTPPRLTTIVKDGRSSGVGGKYVDLLGTVFKVLGLEGSIEHLARSAIKQVKKAETTFSTSDECDNTRPVVQSPSQPLPATSVFKWGQQCGGDQAPSAPPRRRSRRARHKNEVARTAG